ACAVLNSYGGLYPLRTVAADFARAGVTLLPPSVLRSDAGCRMEGAAVRVGLGSIKRLTGRSRKAILEARPFHDLADLLGRTRIPLREMEALVLCGACDE